MTDTSKSISEVFSIILEESNMSSEMKMNYATWFKDVVFMIETQDKIIDTQRKIIETQKQMMALNPE